MSEEERPHYARLYRKGKPVGKIFEANALSEFRRKEEREEAQEEVRLLKGFNYWWHDKVRLRWWGICRWFLSRTMQWWAWFWGSLLAACGVAAFLLGLFNGGRDTEYRHKTESEQKTTEGAGIDKLLPAPLGTPQAPSLKPDTLTVSPDTTLKTLKEKNDGG